ncbi:nitrite/sulfite reductase [Clostridium gasigenes]|uniref:nitrite/sulfite reductase n=1 Tax=Clostridium gasigenes TaxID=94869 RepID=UPI001C0DDB7F|nr:nitrite/sulfite reductase [Clostridium gasigenes]MBU3135915.1 nitrite/sulfite reductase [Clostridium gasigenes]
MTKLKEILLGEIEEFREVGHRFINKEINMMQFKHDSGGMGVYAQRGGEKFMIRFRIPSGMTDIREMRLIRDITEKYNLGGMHFTTRQAIQLHGLDIDPICDIMKEALELDIYTRGSGGNFPRNVAISPLSGVDRDEAFDITPYALAVGNYFMEEIYTYKLPRKLKVSFSSSEEDGAHCSVQDLGFLAVNKDGKEYFKVYLGGGLGRNPKLAVMLDELIELNDILYYVDGMISMFKAEGDYENKNKARVRYILERMGKEEFLKCYKKHVSEVKANGGFDLKLEAKVYNKEGIIINTKHPRLYRQKQEGLYSVYLHPIGGQLTLPQLDIILDELENCDDAEIRLSMTEGVWFRNLNGKEAEGLLKLTHGMGGETNLEQSIACIGTPTCQIGLCNSQGVLNSIIEHFKDKNFNEDILPKVYISGCGNSCGVHQIGGIGFTGKKKRVNDKVEECFELHIGGECKAYDARLGKVYGDLINTEIPRFLYELALLIKEENITFTEFIINRETKFEAIVKKYLV